MVITISYEETRNYPEHDLEHLFAIDASKKIYDEILEILFGIDPAYFPIIKTIIGEYNHDFTKILKKIVIEDKEMK